MKALSAFLAFLFISISFTMCTPEKERHLVLSSPDKTLKIEFILDNEGIPSYSLKHNNLNIIKTSRLGFEFFDASPMDKNFMLLGSDKHSKKEQWIDDLGSYRNVINHYNELKLMLKEKGSKGRRMNLIFRLFNDGLGFRYEFPEQENMIVAKIKEENTEFCLAGDHECWWAPGDWDIYEHLYTHSLFSEIDALSKRGHPNLAQTYIPFNAVNTPITMKTSDGIYLSFHEAMIEDYSDMTLGIDSNGLKMKSILVGTERRPYKVERKLPFMSPWRTIMVSERAGGLIESNLITNLNDECCLEDISWIKPAKYCGIWWEMHLGISSWAKEGGMHGATTAHAKEMIDFAAENDLQAVLVEGWNTGWEHWIGFEDREGVFDFVTPYDDYDLVEVVKYGKQKGVELIMHHETSAATETYEKQMDSAFRLMHSLGIHYIKTGYVGKILPKGEYHHGQYMVRHYRKVVETAAKYQVSVIAHEPIKPTGIRRTFPNMLSREGLRGQEFNAWASDGGNPPEHLPTIAFTRMLAGPIDYTPGIFNIKLEPYKPNNQINTTLTHQLALYVVLNSPVQMAADLIESYKKRPDAFQFIKDVPLSWSKFEVIDGEPGEYLCIRKHTANGDNVYIGCINGKKEREIELNLNDLIASHPGGYYYEARICRDGPEAHWDNNPFDYIIEEKRIDKNNNTIKLRLAPGGGAIIKLTRMRIQNK